MIFNLLFLMNVVSSRRARYIFAHVKPHASNLLFVGLLCGTDLKPDGRKLVTMTFLYMLV